MPILPAQCRAARSMLNWSQSQLAERAKVSRATVASFEAEKRIPIENNLVAIQDALESAGIDIFSEDIGSHVIGVRLRKQSTHWIDAIMKADPAKRQALIESANKDLHVVGLAISYRDSDNCVLVDNKGRVLGIRKTDNQ